MKFKSMHILKNAYEKNGITYLFKKGPKFLFERIMNNVEYFTYIYFFKGNDTFSLNYKKYEYFFHPYNSTWKNERAVEIPIILDKLDQTNGKILELGNVLSNYFNVKHDILDKYDIAFGVINEDVINFKPSYKYDLIVSISTLEHVGWDETPKKPEKVLMALKNLKKCLVQDGEMIFTFPVGYNHFLDQLHNDNEMRFTETYYLKRTSNTKWIETTWDEVRDIKFNEPFPYANAIVVGIIKIS